MPDRSAATRVPSAVGPGRVAGASRQPPGPWPRWSPAFWRRHALWPGLAFLALAWAGATTGLDVALARAWAFDAAAGRFIGAGPGDWWAGGLIHHQGGVFVRALGVILVLAWLVALRRPALARWRRPLGYAVLAATTGALLVGLLKVTTNVDCPRSLELFGGARPYVHLFGDRPDALERAECFPGGHSSSGFALCVLYFALRERYRRAARAALAFALALGVLFAVGQEARGAHFLSHDAWSSAIMWFTALVIYARGYGGRLWDDVPG